MAKKGNEPETNVDSIKWTVIKEHNNIRSLVRVAIPFSIKLTNKAIYSYVFWIIPVGKLDFGEINGFKKVGATIVGVGFFHRAIILSTFEDGRQKQVIFLVFSKKKQESFAESLKSVGIKEIDF